MSSGMPTDRQHNSRDSASCKDRSRITTYCTTVMRRMHPRLTSTFPSKGAIDHFTTRAPTGKKGRSKHKFVKADAHITLDIGTNSIQLKYHGHLYVHYKKSKPQVPSRLADPDEPRLKRGHDTLELWDRQKPHPQRVPFGTPFG